MKRIALTGLLVLGCGGSDEDPSWCESRGGVYQVSMRQESGTCPGSLDFIVNSGGAMMNSGCSDRSSVSENNCSVTLDVTCPSDGGGTFTMTGKIDWNADSSRGGGKVFYVANGPGGCDGLFRITYTRL